MTDDIQFPDQNLAFKAQAEALARRRKLAEQLIQQGMSVKGGAGMVGPVYAVGNQLGDLAQVIGGNVMSHQADQQQQQLEQAQQQAQQDWQQQFNAAPDDATRQQLLSDARNRGLRYDLEQQFAKAEADRIERGEQAAADRVARAQEAEANRIERGEQQAADRVARQDLRATPTIHITNSGGSGQGKPPSGYKWNEDGTLAPIQGGPADKQPGTKPLTAKQLETQRGFMDLQSSLDTYDQLLKGYDFRGKSALDPAARAALEGAYTDVQMKLKTLYELGAPQAGDLRLLEQSLSNPVSTFGTVKGAAFGTEPHLAKTKQLRNLLTNSQANFEKQMGKATPEAAVPPKPAPSVVRTGTRNGVRVEQLSDGTIREVK